MGISTALLDVCVPSGIFCYRNYKKATDKSENGEKTRGTVAFAQAAKIAEAIAKYNDSTAKSAEEAFNIFGKYAEKSRALNYTGKAINWATHNVNPLICASGAIKVLSSDDKLHTGITQVGALSGMFLGEGLMKMYMGNVINEKNILKIAEKFKDTKYIKTIAEKLMKSGNSGKLASIIKGLLFVCGSITSYSIGEKIGKNTADRICKDGGIQTPQAKKIDQKV